jgi:hypothetical protein
MENLKGFNPIDKIEIIKIVNRGLSLWNDSDQILFGEIRNQNLIELTKRALSKRGYLLLDEEINWVLSTLNK